MSRLRKSTSQSDSQNRLGNFLVDWGVRLAFLVVIIVVVLTLAQCTVKKPESPEWNTQLTVPIVSRTYQMAEIVQKIDQDGIHMDADSNVLYSFTRDLDTFLIDQSNLTADSARCDVNGQLGVITIDEPVVSPVVSNIASIAGFPGIFPASVPAVDFDVPATFPPLTDFTSAVVAEGQCYFVITNNLGIDIDVATVVLTDDGQGNTLAIHTFAGGIPAGQTDSISVNLSGRTISNQFSAAIACHTPGGTVNATTGSDLGCELHFNNGLNVTSAMATVPALSRSYSNSVGLQASNLISNGAIASGTLDLEISNNTSLPSNITITIPDLRESGQPLIVVRSINANSSASVALDLSGYALVPSDLSLPQDLPVDVEVAIPRSGNSQVQIDASNDFDVAAEISSLHFSQVTGTFSNLTASVPLTNQEIVVPQGFDSLQFTSAVVTLEIENSMSLPGTLDISLAGNNGKSLQIGGDISPRVLATASTTTLVEPDAATLLSPLPSQLTISGVASFGTSVTGTVRDGDYITGRVTIEAPLELIIKETPIETDITSEHIDQKDIDKITDHVVEARFVYNVINHLPVGATMSIMLSADSASLYLSPDLRFDNLTVDAAPVSASVVTDTLSTGYQQVAITNEDVQILKNDSLFIGYEVVLHDSNGQPVRLTKNDFLSIVGRIEVEYRFDGKF